MSQIARDRLFVALTRPQMFAGVTYSYFVINVIVSAEAFLIFRSLWALVPALIIHGVGMLICLKEPRFVDLWLVRLRQCRRVPNYRLWRSNSYRP
ncbi:MAG: VirB3 family type IV secretion system protein [Sphingomonadales bacterium]|jgi:type IV secretion system protein VirB3